MSTPTMTRPGTGTARRPQAGTAESPRSRRALLLTAALSVVTIAALLGALWAVRTTTLPGSDDVLGAEGGVLRVNEVTPEVLAHLPGMPGTMMPEPVPDGFQRIVLDVTLVGTEASGLSYDAKDFRVVTPDGAAVSASRNGLGAGVVPEGARLDGELVFQVPLDAATLELTGTGFDGSLALPVPEAPAGHNEDAGHDPTAPAGGAVVTP